MDGAPGVAHPSVVNRHQERIPFRTGSTRVVKVSDGLVSRARRPHRPPQPTPVRYADIGSAEARGCGRGVKGL